MNNIIIITNTHDCEINWYFIYIIKSDKNNLETIDEYDSNLASHSDKGWSFKGTKVIEKIIKSLIFILVKKIVYWKY